MKKREVGAEARGGIASEETAVAAIAHARPSAGEPTHGERMSPAEMEAAASRGLRAAGEGASWDAEAHSTDGYRDIDYDPAGRAMEWTKVSSAEPGSDHVRVARPRPVPLS